MSRLTKKIVNLAIITTLLGIVGVIMKEKTTGYVDILSVTILLPSFFVITSVSLAIFYIGQSRPVDSQMKFTIAAIGIKFIFAAILSIVYFVVFKKSEVKFVLLFFILYLTFTFYLTRVILKALKIKSLKIDKI